MKKLLSTFYPSLTGLLILLFFSGPTFVEAQEVDMAIESFVQLVDPDNPRSRFSQEINFYTYKFPDMAITEGPNLEVSNNKTYQLNFSFSYNLKQDPGQTTEMKDYLQQGRNIQVDESAKKVFEVLKTTQLADKFSILVRILGTPTSQEPLRIHLLDKQQQSIAYIDYPIYVRSTTASGTATGIYLKTPPTLHLRFKKTTTRIRYGYFDLTPGATQTLSMKYGDSYNLLFNLTHEIGLNKEKRIAIDYQHAYGYRIEYESPDKWLSVQASGEGKLKGIVSAKFPNPRVAMVFRDKVSYGDHILNIKVYRGSGGKPFGTYQIKFQVIK